MTAVGVIWGGKRGKRTGKKRHMGFTDLDKLRRFRCPQYAPLLAEMRRHGPLKGNVVGAGTNITKLLRYFRIKEKGLGVVHDLRNTGEVIRFMETIGKGKDGAYDHVVLAEALDGPRINHEEIQKGLGLAANLCKKSGTVWIFNFGKGITDGQIAAAGLKSIAKAHDGQRLIYGLQRLVK